jgi:hypothetical protein
MILRLLAVLGLDYCRQCGWWARPSCGHTD